MGLAAAKAFAEAAFNNADVMAHLAPTVDSSDVVGQAINVDGGMTVV